MNPLIDDFPTTVQIDGAEWAVNWDHKTCLLIISAMEDKRLSEMEKQAVLLSLFYPEIPANVVDAIKTAVWFLDCGEEPREETGDGGKNGRIFSLTLNRTSKNGQ